MPTVAGSIPTLNGITHDDGPVSDYHRLNAQVDAAYAEYVAALRTWNARKAAAAPTTYAASELHRRALLAAETCAARRHARVLRLELRRLDASLAIRGISGGNS